MNRRISVFLIKLNSTNQHHICLGLQGLKIEYNGTEIRKFCWQAMTDKLVDRSQKLWYEENLQIMALLTMVWQVVLIEKLYSSCYHCFTPKGCWTMGMGGSLVLRIDGKQNQKPF